MVRLPGPLRPLYPYLKPAYTMVTRVAAPASQQLSRLSRGYLPTGAVQTMEEAAATTGGRCCVVRPSEVVTRPIPRGIPADDPTFEQNRSETVPRVAVAELPGGRVLGPHRAVITGRGDLLWELSFYFGTTRPREHPLFMHPFPPPPLEVTGRLGVLATRGDVNYYHFLVDVMTRLGVQDLCPEIAPPERWYVPAATRFQRELLDLFGIPPEQRIDSTRVPHVRAECLVVPAPPSMTVINPPWVTALLRERLLTEPDARIPGRCIYVTRGSATNNRRVTNESALIEMLSARGFDAIDPGQMSVVDQIRAFAEASIIVAPHGAALANLIFASPGSTVIELFPAGALVPDFWKLASGVPGLEYRYLSGQGDPSSRGRAQLIVSDIEVDLDGLAGMLDEVQERDAQPS
ncbi:MAG TPA: glycosyltransferase family 61 protein [Acidimicrobiales bacterium]|nr:glycosyltransferase family 61 protein [Acidimicrobiales bacterium]